MGNCIIHVFIIVQVPRPLSEYKGCKRIGKRKEDDLAKVGVCPKHVWIIGSGSTLSPQESRKMPSIPFNSAIFFYCYNPHSIRRTICECGCLVFPSELKWSLFPINQSDPLSENNIEICLGLNRGWRGGWLENWNSSRYRAGYSWTNTRAKSRCINQKMVSGRTNWTKCNRGFVDNRDQWSRSKQMLVREQHKMIISILIKLVYNSSRLYFQYSSQYW